MNVSACIFLFYLGKDVKKSVSPTTDQGHDTPKSPILNLQKNTAVGSTPKDLLPY